MRLSGRKASSYAPRWKSRQRLVLLSLVGLNLVIFVAQQLLQLFEPGAVAQYFGLSYLGIDQAYAWQFVTAMFLHAGVFSFGGSMFVLYLIGRDVEAIIGQRHFLYLYLLGAIGGELAHLFLMPATTVLLAGAGGVAAVVVAFGTIVPELELTESLFFLLPLKIKAKHFAGALCVLSAVLLVVDRHGVVGHSACLGGCVAGRLYTHLLGYGWPSFLQRVLRQRRLENERRRQMSPGEFITQKIDPLLEKISRSGLASLSRGERRTLAQARGKMLAPEEI